MTVDEIIAIYKKQIINHDVVAFDNYWTNFLTMSHRTY